MKSNYTFTVEEGVLCITDLGPHDVYQTVTNNAEGVLQEIKDQFVANDNPFPEMIVYCDSEGIWDELWWKGGDVSFRCMSVDTRQDAIDSVKINRGNGRSRSS